MFCSWQGLYSLQNEVVMERLSARKKSDMVRQYLSGLSYDKIAARSGVSKGTVANVGADLKAASFPRGSRSG